MAKPRIENIVKLVERLPKVGDGDNWERAVEAALTQIVALLAERDREAE